ncbi:unnamed protein product [Absidia cylindrospora]
MDISQPSIDGLGQHCYQLSELTVANCWKLGPDTFSALVDCPLEKLCIEYPSSGLETWKAVMDLTSHFDRLTELELLCSPLRLMERLLSTATTSWPHLTHLTIDNYKVTPTGDGGALIPFLQTHPGLQILDLRQGQFNSLFLEAMSAIHPKITQLHLWCVHGVTDTAVLRQLVQDCPLLCYLSLGACHIPSSKFPEAGVACLDGRDHTTVHHLDQEAINKIRLAV